MIQHKPIGTPSIDGSYLQKGLTISLLLWVDVDSTPKNYLLARRDRSPRQCQRLSQCRGRAKSQSQKEFTDSI